MKEETWFAWEGAAAPNGPWAHLRVIDMHGFDELNRLYEISVELRREPETPEVDVTEMLGQWATIKIATRTDPAFRVIHGIISSAEQAGDFDHDIRYRVVLSPPVIQASMMKKSRIFLDKTLQEIIDATLMSQYSGAALARSTTVADLIEDLSSLTAWTTPRATFGWSVSNSPRLSDKTARPYCVQYEEDDWSFVARLLEEEGIRVHFEHNDEECVMVLSDNDAGAFVLSDDAPIGPAIVSREAYDIRFGGRVRPTRVALGDYNWQKPDLDLRAVTDGKESDEFAVIEHPGRYEASKETGKLLANIRKERLDTERTYATANTSCRLLTAGTFFTLQHSNAAVAGKYLVVRVEHRFDWDGGAEGASGQYRGKLWLVQASDANGGKTAFRPERRTPRPRIHGSQLAVVTADPSAQGQEIWVGGPSDLGCVRLQFMWDEDVMRWEKEPTSCWVRVSQFFAGANHGAMWHPRVGNEVIVEYLDGDPDRPIVTGRVYNGKNLPPENATARPTFSAIKSLTSPYNGNYNMLAFDDEQGKEKIILHAAKDFETNVLHDANRDVGNNDHIHVKGDRTTLIDGNDSLTIGQSATTTIGAGEMRSVTDSRLTNIGQSETTAIGAGETHSVTDSRLTAIGASDTTIAGSEITLIAPTVRVEGEAMLMGVSPVTTIMGKVTLLLTGAAVTISGAAIDITAKGDISVTGATINLNC